MHSRLLLPATFGLFMPTAALPTGTAQRWSCPTVRELCILLCGKRQAALAGRTTASDVLGQVFCPA
jgi:hypothetical protein